MLYLPNDKINSYLFRARDKERSKSTVERKTRRESDSRLLTEMQSQHLETKSEDEDHNASTFLDSRLNFYSSFLFFCL